MIGLALALSIATGAYAPQQAGSEPLAPPLEARVQKLGKELRCAVCQGLSITDSPASMARAQLDKVRQLISEGKSDDEVKEYFVQRYGEWVLLRPEAHGVNWIVWLGPGAILLGGLAIILSMVGKNGASSPAASPTDPTDSAEDPYLKAVREEIER